MGENASHCVTTAAEHVMRSVENMLDGLVDEDRFMGRVIDRWNRRTLIQDR